MITEAVAEREHYLAAGEQVCHGFDWSWYWVYGFTVRVYYSPKKDHPKGEITLPGPNATVGDMTKLAVNASGHNAAVSRVDFVGNYEDYNWEGDGQYRRWHYQSERGVMKRNLATAARAPWEATWDATWVPDQTQPVRIIAWITNTSGVTYVTPEISVKLAHPNRSVKMYTTRRLPEKFGVRDSGRMSCEIEIAARSFQGEAGAAGALHLVGRPRRGGRPERDEVVGSPRRGA